MDTLSGLSWRLPLHNLLGIALPPGASRFPKLSWAAAPLGMMMFLYQRSDVGVGLVWDGADVRCLMSILPTLETSEQT